MPSATTAPSATQLAVTPAVATPLKMSEMPQSEHGPMICSTAHIYRERADLIVHPFLEVAVHPRCRQRSTTLGATRPSTAVSTMQESALVDRPSRTVAEPPSVGNVEDHSSDLIGAVRTAAQDAGVVVAVQTSVEDRHSRSPGLSR